MKKTITSYTWDHTTTDPVITSALSVLSGRYPVLNGNDNATTITFKKSDDPTLCTAQKDLGGAITITYGRANMAIRMVGNILADSSATISEKCPFNTLGIMLDCSRNAVMTVKHLKTYLDRLAILGYNMVMLYTEDTFRPEGEPLFGFMRSAYRQSEIREIDDYAASLGIELIPCIEALGHMDQIFKWGKYADIRDKDGILLVDEEKTYALIEKMVVFWKEAVRSSRIHLGMDEAHGLGTGRHEEIHGKESAFDIINRHLERCCKICEKHGLKPMIWSDMYFRIGSKTNDYYDLDSQPPQSVIDGVPKGLELVYWDYYHENQDFYEKFIEKHRAIAGDPLMGSGVWTWDKFWYDHTITRNTVIPCLAACREKNLKEVFFTMWGDRGGFCDYDSAFAGLAFSADLSFRGEADPEHLEKILKTLFGGASYKAITTLGELMLWNIPSFIFDDPLMLLYIRSFCNTKEPWTNNDEKTDYATLKKGFLDVAKVLKKAPDGDAGSMALARALVSSINAKFAYADAAFETLKKSEHRTDAPALLKLANKYEAAISEFYTEFCDMWNTHNKPCGLESIQLRLGGQVIRAGELVCRLEDFINSDDTTIPELVDLCEAGDEVILSRWACEARWSNYVTIANASCIF